MGMHAPALERLITGVQLPPQHFIHVDFCNADWYIAFEVLQLGTLKLMGARSAIIQAQAISAVVKE